MQFIFELLIIVDNTLVEGIDIGPNFSMEYVSPRICRVWNALSEATSDLKQRDFDLDFEADSDITSIPEKKFRQISKEEEEESIIIFFRSNSGLRALYF